MNGNNEDDISSSIITTTRYGHNSARILRSIERNFVLVIAIVAAAFVFSLLDSAGILNYFDLYSETAHDTIATIFSIVSLAAMIPLLAYVVKSRKLFEKWQNLFEHNSLKSSFELSLTGISRDEIVRAIAESVEEVSEPLREYISSEMTGAFIFQGSKDFDILIDADSLNSNSQSTSDDARGRLKMVLKEFGSICVRISSDNDNPVGAPEVNSFVQALQKYVLSTGNYVGLGIILGANIKADAYKALEDHIVGTRKKIRDVLIVEKPSIPTLQ